MKTCSNTVVVLVGIFLVISETAATARTLRMANARRLLHSQSYSELSCEDLIKKEYPFKFHGNNEVCATASVEPIGDDDDDVKCDNRMSWSAAKNKCEEIGARICSIGEFETDVLLNVGCHLNTKHAWTSEPCVADWETGETGFLAAETDGGREAECRSSADGLARIACCADSGSSSSSTSSSSGNHVNQDK